jgi:hypothetical protein
MALPLVDRKTRLGAFLVGAPESLRYKTITRSAKDRLSTGWPVNTVSKA